jgi:hypothetical protein
LLGVLLSCYLRDDMFRKVNDFKRKKKGNTLSSRVKIIQKRYGLKE